MIAKFQIWGDQDHDFLICVLFKIIHEVKQSVFFIFFYFFINELLGLFLILDNVRLYDWSTFGIFLRLLFLSFGDDWYNVKIDLL